MNEKDDLEQRYAKLIKGYEKYQRETPEGNFGYIRPLEALNDNRYISKKEKEKIEKESSCFENNVWRGGFIGEERFWLLILTIALLTLVIYIFCPNKFITEKAYSDIETINTQNYTEREIKYSNGKLLSSSTILTKENNNQILYGKDLDWWINFITWKILFIFFISFSTVQYGRAKRLRIATQNRIAMAKFWYNLDEESRHKVYAPYVLPAITKMLFDEKDEVSTKPEIETPIAKIKFETGNDN